MVCLALMLREMVHARARLGLRRDCQPRKESLEQDPSISSFTTQIGEWNH